MDNLLFFFAFVAAAFLLGKVQHALNQAADRRPVPIRSTAQRQPEGNR